MAAVRGRWGALAGLAFVVLYVATFAATGIEVGDSEREVLDCSRASPCCARRRR